MHGLEHIDVFIYADVEMPSSSISESWFTSLFNLQQGANGLRDLKIHVYPVTAYHVVAGSQPLIQPHESTPQTEHLDKTLQERIKKGIEAYSEKDTTTVPAALVASPKTSEA